MARLTDREIARYHEQGWIVPDYRVPADLLADAKARATATVWVALDASTPENGCLRVISSSHKAGRLFPHHPRDGDLTLHQEIDADAYDRSRAADIVLEAGQVSIHDVYLIHGSEPNRSDKRRAGVT